MTLIPGSSNLREDAVQLATFLVDARGLGLDELRRAILLQRAQELRFSEAVLQLGLASQADIDSARRFGHEQPQPAAGQMSPALQPYLDAGNRQSQRISALRAELMLRVGPGEGVRLAVVSPSAGDGRSQLAAALAIACARLEQPTLLIDADLLNPVQHRLFGLGDGPGLAQALQGDTLPRPQTVQGLPQLAVLGAGSRVENPLELLSGRLFSDLIISFSSQYRHIILDTSAGESGFDGVTAAIAVGSALLLAHRDHTPLDASQQLLTRLRGSRARLMGGVLNVFDRR